ncbi:MAG TPA: hypothetical protein VK530_16980 [Candidatus Acidoferrum sp.]|nr:hypothetical protein [Candidatus Acidoferrum sp.]
MKLISIAGIICAGLVMLQAADKIVTGPKGGRILEKTAPQAEFLVSSNRSVSIHFYDAAAKGIAPTTQNVTLIVETPGARNKVEFDTKGDALVSKTALPDGDGYNVVVQFRQSSDAKPQNYRFPLDMSSCGGCKRAEYACSCH